MELTPEERRKARSAIMGELRQVPAGSVAGLRTLARERAGINESDAGRELKIMEDEGLIVPTGDYNVSYRISSKGDSHPRTSIEKALRYLLDNWIAIVGAVTGITGIIISLVALFKD